MDLFSNLQNVHDNNGNLSGYDISSAWSPIPVNRKIGVDRLVLIGSGDRQKHADGTDDVSGQIGFEGGLKSPDVERTDMGASSIDREAVDREGETGLPGKLQDESGACFVIDHGFGSQPVLGDISELDEWFSGGSRYCRIVWKVICVEKICVESKWFGDITGQKSRGDGRSSIVGGWNPGKRG